MKTKRFIQLTLVFFAFIIWACEEYQPYEKQVTDFSIHLNKVVKQKNLSSVCADFSVTYNTRVHVSKIALSIAPLMTDVKRGSKVCSVQHVGYPHYEITVSDSTDCEECFAAVFAVVDGKDTVWSNVMPIEVHATEYGDSVLNGHRYVDLGLPSGTLWAECNIGAQEPREAGYMFAWGEVEPKESYTWETYKYCKGTKSSLTKYNTETSYGETPDNLTVLEDEDDAAYLLWGEGWHIPSPVQFEELSYYCYILYEAQGKNNGFRVVGLNGKEIYLPGEGSRLGWYWSNALSASTRVTFPSEACGWKQWSTSQRVSNTFRYKQGMIRPVCKSVRQ